ncbi:MAG: hypothetical protein ACXVAR_07810 [Vulcanimicrobiaceae bacterium]
MRYSNAMCVSGLGTKPAIDDFTAIGTVVWSIGNAGTWPLIRAFAAR